MNDKNSVEDYKERLISNFEEIAKEVDGDITLLPIGQIINLIKVTE